MTEAEFIDFQRDEVVGRVVDDELSIEDEVFESVLMESVLTEDRSLNAIFPGDEPKSYVEREIEEGENGYALTLGDELPAPFDFADLSVRSELSTPDFEPDDEKNVLRRSLAASVPDDDSHLTDEDSIDERNGEDVSEDSKASLPSECRVCGKRERQDGAMTCDVCAQKADYMYPDAPHEDAPQEVKEAVKRWREDVDMEQKREQPLVYWLLGTGTPDYKMSKPDSDYQHQPEQGMMCSNCEYYYVGVDGRAVCSQVRGKVQGEHWCRLWEAEDDLEMDKSSTPSVEFGEDEADEKLRTIERELLRRYQDQVWIDDLSKAPDMWEGDENVPKYVQNWLEETVELIDPVWDKGYSGLPPAAGARINTIITEEVRSGRWSSGSISDRIQGEFDEVDEGQANTIARNEVSALLNRARETALKARPGELNYDWVGPDDASTTVICTEIKAAVPDEGLPMEELRDVAKEVAETWTQRGGTPDRVDDWLPHFKCRHTIDVVESNKSVSKRRVYIDSPEDAPESANVQEGARGGLYYDTEDDSESEPDSGPSGMVNIDGADVEQYDYVSIGDAEGFVEEVGRSGGKVRLELSSGERVYVGEGDDVFIDDDEEYPFGESNRAADDVTIRNFSEYSAMSQEDARHTLSSIEARAKADEVIEEVYDTVKVEDDADGSLWDSESKSVQIASSAPDDVLAHEMGHATVGAFGAETADVGGLTASFYDGNAPDFEIGESIVEYAREKIDEKVPNRFVEEDRQNLIEQQLQGIKERFEGEAIEKEGLKLSTPIPDAPEEVKELVDAVNAAWERQFDAASEDNTNAERQRIGKNYSIYNAHETMSMTHQTMQGGIADRQTMKNLMDRHPDLLEAYLEIFEPDENAKMMLSLAFYDVGPNEVFDEEPYPDVTEDY